MDKEIQRYKFIGKIACWKFIENTRNYPGWNICFDDSGRASLIGLLEKMKESDWPSKKEIQMGDPFEMNQDWIRNVGIYRFAGSIIISNKKEPLDLWKMNENNSKLTISVGNDKIDILKSAIKNQFFDRALSGVQENDSDVLYFW